MKRIVFTALMVALFVCLLAFSAYATEINYAETATIADGTVVPIYDAEHNPLIWYVSGTDSEGENIYASVPNNRNSANENKDTYVTYTINTSWMTQLENINIHIWNDNLGDYQVFTEENLQVVVVNLRGLTSFEYIHRGLKVSNIQYIYFNEILKDFCEYFKGSTALRLVDLSVCINLSGGLGGARNFYNCTNLHTIRLAPGTSYTLTCSANSNWRFSYTAITEIVITPNITSIGIDNFKNCTKLESIYILGNTTSLGQRNFYGCSNLTNIYILGDNPQIDITSFRENFYECVDGNTTYDFTTVGKYFFFVSTNEEYLNQVKEAIGATAIVPYADYVANPSNYVEGRYIISGTSICDVYYGEHEIDQANANPCAGLCTVCGNTVVNHTGENFVVTVEYQSYLMAGLKITSCNNEGCTYKTTEEVKALFTCLGYSASESGSAGIAIGYLVSNEAISEYIAITGKTVNYGVFAVLKDKIGNSDIFSPDGGVADGVITADISDHNFEVFELKITGLSEEQKSIEMAIGAYVMVTNGETMEYSYLQSGTPNEGEKYSYVSYNDIITSSEI